MATYNSLLAYWIGGVGKHTALQEYTYLAESVITNNYYPIFANNTILACRIKNSSSVTITNYMIHGSVGAPIITKKTIK